MSTKRLDGRLLGAKDGDLRPLDECERVILCDLVHRATGGWELRWPARDINDPAGWITELAATIGTAWRKLMEDCSRYREYEQALDRLKVNDPVAYERVKNERQT